jgi:PEP-CTERM motif
MFKKFLLATVMSLALSGGASAAELINGPATGSIGSFGPNASPTYGQVFTAPISGTLSSFTLWLNGGVGALFGGVGTWNGPAGFATGFGSPTNLFQSGTVAATTGGAFTFAPNVSVTAGSRYVAYLSTSGVAGALGSTTLQTTSNNVAGIDYFVWNNGGSPINNSAWNYFADFGDARFDAVINASAAVPEPATWAMMLLGFGLVGGAMRRRKLAAPLALA